MLAVASPDAEEAMRILEAHEDSRLGADERAAIETVQNLDGETCPACLEPLTTEASACGSCGLRFG